MKSNVEYEYEYGYCKVCGRLLTSFTSRKRGAGTTCFIKSVEHEIPENRLNIVFKRYHLVRLEELKAKKERKNVRQR